MSGSRSPCRFAPSSARFVCSLCSVCPAGAVVPAVRVPTGDARGVFPGPGASGGSSGGGAPDGVPPFLRWRPLQPKLPARAPGGLWSRPVFPAGRPASCSRPVGPGAPSVPLGDHLSGPSAVPFLAAGPRAVFSRGCVTGRARRSHRMRSPVVRPPCRRTPGLWCSVLAVVRSPRRVPARRCPALSGRASGRPGPSGRPRPCPRPCLPPAACRLSVRPVAQLSACRVGSRARCQEFR